MFVNLKECLSSPKQILRLSAIILCICIACYQLSECFRKILNPPKMTHYNFQLNKTMNYPAVTICRNPPFKDSVLAKYGLTGDVSYGYSWKSFNFSNYTLEEFFNEATYKLEEVIPLYGFDGFNTNVSVTSSFSLTYGKCFTITAKNATPKWSSASGYAFYLKHSRLTPYQIQDETSDVARKARTYETSLAGFHIYVRHRTEMFIEQSNQEHSFTEHIYVHSGDDLQIDLRPQEFTQLPTSNDKCVNDFDYSLSKCKEMCMYETITQIVGCSSPWMPNDKVPQCTDYESVNELIMYYKYSSYYGTAKECECHKSCFIVVYGPSVRSRKFTGASDSNVAIYFSSNLVTKMQEVLAYDWTLFLADLGGSLGFLLGVSVLSIIAVLEQMFVVLLGNKLNRNEPNVLEIREKRADNGTTAEKSNDDLSTREKNILGAFAAQNKKYAEKNCI